MKFIVQVFSGEGKSVGVQKNEFDTRKEATNFLKMSKIKGVFKVGHRLWSIVK